MSFSLLLIVLSFTLSIELALRLQSLAWRSSHPEGAANAIWRLAYAFGGASIDATKKSRPPVRRSCGAAPLPRLVARASALLWRRPPLPSSGASRALRCRPASARNIEAARLRKRTLALTAYVPYGSPER